MKRVLPRRVALGFAAALMAAIVGGPASFQAHKVRTENSGAVNHALATLNALKKPIDALRDADISQRGFLLTGDERYLAQFRTVMQQEDTNLAVLQELARASPELSSRYPELEALVRQKLADLRVTMEIVRRKGRKAALETINGALGIGQMERIGQVVSIMEALERTRLEERQRAWTRSIFVSNAVLVGLSLLLLMVIVVAANEVRRELRAREASAAELARFIQLQQQLMGIVGHDLRTPLAAVMASAELLARASELSQERRRAAQRIIQSGRRMERMIRDLLDYARAQVEGRLAVNPRLTNLEEICQRVKENLELEHPDHQIEQAHAGEVTGEWDPDRLEQVICNLVTNALRYGSGEAPVRLATTGASNTVSLEVHNQGDPIPADRLQRLFQPFQRGSDNAGGIGLGLFIVRTLVEEHGGHVAVESRPGEGTTFRVELPRWRSGSGPQLADQRQANWSSNLNPPARA